MKDIDGMNAVEICQYLNSGNHTLPIILKHGESYDVYWSKRKGLKNYPECRTNLNFKDAIRTFKKCVLSEENE